MTEPTGAPAGDIAAPANDTSELTLEQARHMLDEPDTAESAESATADPELAQANADPETAPSEEPEGDDPEAEKLPPIERPRSWSKDDDDEWNALPRGRQEKIVANERARESDIRQRINDAAEKNKAAEAKFKEAEQARQQYEVKISSAMQMLEREQTRDFPDIKTMADVERMAAEDPFRKIQWDTHQQKMAVVAYEDQQAKTRQQQEAQTEWTNHVQKENALAAEHIPELADKIKGPELTKRAADRLTELGFKPEELNDLASGKSKLSIYDHRLQQLIFSDLKLSDIQKAKAVATAKSLPPVQRPGVARPAGAADSDNLRALEDRLTRTGSVKDAEALLNAQIAASRRRAS